MSHNLTMTLEEYYDTLKGLEFSEHEAVSRLEHLTNLIESHADHPFINKTRAVLMNTCIVFANAIGLTDEQVLQYKDALYSCIAYDDSFDIEPFYNILFQLVSRTISRTQDFLYSIQESKIALKTRRDGQFLLARINNLVELNQ